MTGLTPRIRRAKRLIDSRAVREEAAAKNVRLPGLFRCGFRCARINSFAVLLAAASAAYCAAPAEETPPAQNIKLNFKDTQLEAVIEQLSELTGLTIVKDVAVEGRITIISKQAMNVEEAIALLNSVLLEKGYVGIRTGKVLKLIKLDEAKKHNIPVRVGADPAQIEISDQVVTQVIPIKYIDAAQLKKDFAPMIPPYADLSSNSGSNTLILTDTSANVRRIAEMIQAMDKQSTALAEVKVFQLKYANATSAAKLINDIFKEEEEKSGLLANAPAFFRGFGGGGPGGGGRPNQPAQPEPDQQSQKLKKVTAAADDRTNAIVISANPDTMLTISQIIKELDSNPAEEQGVFIYHCMNAQSANLETVVNTLFSSNTQSSSIKRTATTPQLTTGIGQNVQRSPSSSSLPGAQATPAPAPQPSFNQPSQSQAASGASSRPASLSGDLTGQVFVVADTDTNSLIVLTSSKHFDRVRAILKDLDRPVAQVLIKVLIAEVTHDKSRDIGLDSSILTKGSVQSAVTSFGVASETGGLIAKTLIDKDVALTLGALEKISKVDVLSRPYILATDNQLATITVGNEVPFIINSLTTDTGQQINTIQYQDIGIILNVTPHINEEGLVIMDIAPQVSDLTGQTVPIAANVNAPVFSKRSAQSRVGIRDGQTVVIGGMMEDKKTDSENGIPVLRKVPGLGVLFRRRQSDKTKTELLIFLTPHVAHIPDVLKDMTEQEKAGLKIAPKAVGPGVYEEHLEGMERGNLDGLQPAEIVEPIAPPGPPEPPAPVAPPPPVTPPVTPPARP